MVSSQISRVGPAVMMAMSVVDAHVPVRAAAWPGWRCGCGRAGGRLGLGTVAAAVAFEHGRLRVGSPVAACVEQRKDALVEEKAIAQRKGHLRVLLFRRAPVPGCARSTPVNR